MRYESSAMTTLALRVRHLCDSAAMSRERLSVACGLTASHLGLIVAGRNHALHSDTATKIASTFGCSLEWLINGKGEAPTEEAIREAVDAAIRGAA